MNYYVFILVNGGWLSGYNGLFVIKCVVVVVFIDEGNVLVYYFRMVVKYVLEIVMKFRNVICKDV